MRYFIILLTALALIPLSSLPEASAQKVKIIRGKDKVMYRKKTVIEFDGDTVDGELVKPVGNYMVQRGRAKFSSMIKIRAHFVTEMWKNARKL